MTRDDVIRMAREARLHLPCWNEWEEPKKDIPSWVVISASGPALERFADLVAAAEREACAAECDARVFAKDGGGNLYRREATASQCATAIRNRGNNPPSPKHSLPVVNPSEIGSLYLTAISERNL